MVKLRRYFLLSVLLLSFSNILSAQSLIFSGDSAIVISCANRPPDIDSHKIYNTTDETIGLRWKRTQFQLPAESDFFMIFNGAQYPLFIYEGIRGISAHDSVDIIFQFWHDTLFPGDSVIVQIMVYDDEDSLNTVHHLTVIQHCPLQTSITQPAIENQLQVFPNPVTDVVNIKIPENSIASAIILFDNTGDVIRKWPSPGHEINLSLEDLPGGMYFIGAESHNQIIGIKRIVLIEK